MRSLAFLAATLAIMALAFWAYRENYRTHAELAEVRALRSEIGELREGLSVLRAEWAYLNRPDRLRELADINFPRLGLLPLEPQQFGDVRQVGYPMPPLRDLSEPVDVAALNGRTP
ncbi:MAG: cell division protein FtsL [Defluviimonas sp.]|uniref:cell division protein FtsL n=1 Tax=Albidovulum sp. TaxID=1872424 RepID=UPI001E015505|nr:cell division protein FtsL [Paracoccaceae bacterium]MCC0063594.1 cell division protein FtsL [Defluviimonas sp.]